MTMDMSKFLSKFIDEAKEHVSKLNSGLVLLEKRPGDQEIINGIFRSAHTIKGSSRMMKLLQITEVAHKLEDALGSLRDAKVSHSKKLADLLFEGVDAISGMLKLVSEGKEISSDHAALCDKLSGAAAGRLPEDRQVSTPEPAESSVTEAEPPRDMPLPAAVVNKTEGSERTSAESPASSARTEDDTAKVAATVRVNSGKLDDLIKLMGEIVSGQNRLKQRVVDMLAAEKMSQRFTTRLEGIAASGGPHQAGLEEAAALAKELSSKLRSVRAGLKEDVALQELLTTELRDRALMLRMVPLSTVFDSLPRMARDMARASGKEIDLVISGGEIELDRKMTEKIGDPLLHMIRNAIDHAIETPEERKTAGKPQTGTVRVSACYDAGNVFIEVRDDGRGISASKIREKALKKQLFSEKELDGMSESELTDLIFLPGFSTSALVTDISGRGVGMDVVKKNVVEELSGLISIRTAEGEGTAFLIRLPLTLAIVRVLLFIVSDTTFALPAGHVREIIRMPESGLITVVDKKAVRLRDELIPVVHLRKLLGLTGEDKTAGRDPFILITGLGSAKLGLAVDGLLAEDDMVIKPLPGHMKNTRLVSGATISGKNEIINVLHLPAVVEAARNVGEVRLQAEETAERSRQLQILVVDDSYTTRDIEKGILEAHGYKVDLAGDGMEGLEKAAAMIYDVVITDVEMPKMDGFSLCQRLRSDQRYKDTPIIIVTSREKEEDKRRGIAVGADAYIVKGDFDQSNLLETVRNLAG